jgi:hypothetical protein
MMVKELGDNIPAESLDQADFALSDWFEGIGANDAAGDRSQAADTFTKAVDYEILADELDIKGWRHSLIEAYHPCASGLSSSCLICWA